MSLGKLLAAGKSLVGLRDDGSRYRVDKQARLPKFISPKNPFTPAGEPSKDQPVGEARLTVATAEARPVLATSRAGRTELGNKISRTPLGARAANWLGDWGKKLNPLPRRTAQNSPARSAAHGAPPTATQPELSLDRVQVVRNDLSETDFEVVTPTRSLRPGTQMMSATAQKLEPVGAVWNRLTARFFGEDQF